MNYELIYNLLVRRGKSREESKSYENTISFRGVWAEQTTVIIYVNSLQENIS